MRRFALLSILAIAAWLTCLSAAQAWEPRVKGALASELPRGRHTSWNGGYYKPEWGMPIALVVPPTAESQFHYGWGVGNTRLTAISPQFKRAYWGEGTYDRSLFLPTPPRPSDTDQFGVYYGRGPW
jgi:hypothetical protein